MGRKAAAVICGMFVAASAAGCGVYVTADDVWCEASENSGASAGTYSTSGEMEGMAVQAGGTSGEMEGMAVQAGGTSGEMEGAAYALESIAVEGDGGGASAARYGAAYVSGISTKAERKQRSKTFQPYSQYGMVYDEGKDELQYNGKAVRWFEDYYQLSEEESCGLDFFNEKGVVDVHAVRDFSKPVTNWDGSIDPAGELVGLEPFSEKEFAARDIEAIKNPPVPVCYAAEDGVGLDKAEQERIAAEYEPFGVTYDAKKDQWYFKGEKVRYFHDILTSNGESLSSGKFSGSMRTLGSGEGTVDIETVRDFQKPDAEGNGTLTGVKEISQEEYGKRKAEAYFTEE